MLCEFAQKFPPIIADFMEHGRKTRRRYKEDTITDLMVAHLRELAPGHIHFDFPDEPNTGADMEWDFVNRSDGSFYRLNLQAKCAYGNEDDSSRHTYKWLSYRVGKNKDRYQADVLCQAATQANVPTWPMYIFYNPSLTCALANDDYLGPTIEGINLADGYQIRSLATSGLRRIPTIRQHLHSLTLLFCATDNRIPTPVDVRQYLLQHVSNYLGFPAGVRDQLVEDGYARIPPEVGTSIPHEVLARLEAEATDDAPRPLARWRLIFVSDDVEPRHPEAS